LKRFEDYKLEVIRTYEKKKSEGNLPPNLLRHTPAKLKRECMDEFSNRYLDSDQHTFTSLFGKGNSKVEFLKLVKDSNPDLFRPLNTYLRRNTTGGTHDRNIELLAWLIDFKERPHQGVDPYELVDSEWNSPSTMKENISTEIKFSEEKSELEEELIGSEIKIDSAEKKIEKEKQRGLTIIDDDPQNVDKGIFGIPPKFNKTILAFFATLVLLIGVYICYRVFYNPQCMYWDKDHYQPIDCDQKVDGATIIAVDTASLKHLKRITNLSSITINDIGKVHYSKVDNKVEFYTTGGDNPTDHRKRLLPLSKHMYEKYVLHKY